MGENDILHFVSLAENMVVLHDTFFFIIIIVNLTYSTRKEHRNLKEGCMYKNCAGNRYKVFMKHINVTLFSLGINGQ